MEPILITAIGGLGNQMFCYAFYRKMCMDYPNIQFKMDTSDIYNPKFCNNLELLQAFPQLEFDMATPKEIWEIEGKLTFKYRGKGSRYIRKCVDAINESTMKNGKEKRMTEEKFLSMKRKISSDKWTEIKYFDGFWQDISYYQDLMSELQSQFTFAKDSNQDNLKLIQDMHKKNSVSVHIRRGDYVGEVFDILTTEYYSNIIHAIKKESPDSHFYFFSNDASYVEKEYQWLSEKTIIRHNIGTNSFRDMQLMSCCKYNIIANSTFSLWAALLNTNPEKKVYYPDYFYAGRKMQIIELPGFVQIPVKEMEKNEIS